MDTIDKINYYLVKQGQSGADLSRALGLSNSVYSQWNTKKTKPRKSKLQAIAEYLDVSVSDLIGDDIPEPPQPEVAHIPKLVKKSPDPETGGLSADQLLAVEMIKQMDDDTLRRFIKAAKAMLED